MVKKPLCEMSFTGILPKIWKFQNAPKSIIDLYDISFITVIGVIVTKDCTYRPD